jgi:hypothetical protein
MQALVEEHDVIPLRANATCMRVEQRTAYYPVSAYRFAHAGYLLPSNDAITRLVAVTIVGWFWA